MDNQTTRRGEWLRSNGFQEDPFDPEAVRAEADRLLRVGAFISFDYYDSVKGRPDTPGPRFIFGKRGGGKTAFRIQISRDFDDTLQNDEERILSIEYTDFDPVLERANHNPKEVRPRHHVEQIVSLIVQRLFFLMVQDESPIELDSLNNSEKRLFAWYAQNFGVLHPWQRDILEGRVDGLDRFFTSDKVLKLGQGILKLAAETVSSTAGKVVDLLNELVAIQPPVAIEPNQVPLKDLLENIVQICQKLKIGAVYVLVDDVDEPQYYGEKNDFEPAFDLIRPLAASPKLLGIKGLIFKFFLPYEVRERCLISFRLDKFSEHVIVWSYESLKNMLQTRLETASEGNRDTLSAICDVDSKHIDEWITDFAKEQGNPRALVYVGNELFEEHLRRETQVEEKITRAVWERARLRAKEVLA